MNPALKGKQIKGMMHITDWWATLSTLTGQTVDDPKAAAAGLPAPDSLNMWPMLTGATTTSPRDTLVLRSVPGSDEGAVIKTMKLPGSAVSARFKLVTGAQGGYFGGQYAPNNTKAVNLPACVSGCLFNLDLDPTEHVDLSTDPRYAATLAALQAELQNASVTYYQSPGSEAASHNATLWAEAHGGFWGPWRTTPYPVTPPPTPAPPLPPTPPKRGFSLTKSADIARNSAACLTVDGLDQGAVAIYGACDGGSHWDYDEEYPEALINVAAKSQRLGYLRESPSKNCSVGNTAQLGMAGHAGAIVTVFDEASGLLRESACGSSGSGLCLGVVGTRIQLMSCSAAGAQGWTKETSGHRADPFEIFS